MEEPHEAIEADPVNKQHLGSINGMADPNIEAETIKVFESGYAVEMFFLNNKISKQAYCKINSSINAEFDTLSYKMSQYFVRQVREVEQLSVSKQCRQIRLKWYYNNGRTVRM